MTTSDLPGHEGDVARYYTDQVLGRSGLTSLHPYHGSGSAEASRPVAELSIETLTERARKAADEAGAWASSLHGLADRVYGPRVLVGLAGGSVIVTNPAVPPMPPGQIALLAEEIGRFHMALADIERAASRLASLA